MNVENVEYLSASVLATRFNVSKASSVLRWVRAWKRLGHTVRSIPDPDHKAHTLFCLEDVRKLMSTRPDLSAAGAKGSISRGRKLRIR